MTTIKKARLTTTLAKLREHSAWESGYRKLLKSLGAKWPADKPINLLRILKSNGVQDMLWCLRCTLEENFKVRLLMSADFAESVLKYFTKYDANDKRPAAAIKAARDLAAGRITQAQSDAWAAEAAEAAWAAGAAWAARAAWAAQAAGAAWAAEAAEAAGAAGAAEAARAAWAAEAARAA